MSAMDQMTKILSQVQNFLLQNIENTKCVLFIGPKGSGKSTFINYLCGYAYTREDNEEGYPYLVQNANIAPQQQPTVYKHGKIPFQLTTFKTSNPNDGEQVTIIEMPSFVNLKQHSQQQNNEQAGILFDRVLFTLFVWKTIANTAKFMHICLVFPYQFITDDHKLVQFLTAWQKSIISSQQVKGNLQKCLSIIFTKPEYEDDIQSLIQSLQHIVQADNQGINLNNTFSNAAQQNRIYCFLSQDTEQGQGQQLLNSILSNAAFYQQQMLSLVWEQNLIWSIIKQQNVERLKVFMQLIENFFKKYINIQEIYLKPFQKSLPLLGFAVLTNFLKLLPEGNPLKQKSSQLQNEINNQLKKQYIISPQIFSSLQKGGPKKQQSYFKFLIEINSLIQKGMNIQILIPQFNQKLQSAFWNLFEINNRQKNIVANWLDQKTIIWKLLDLFQKVCQKYKENEQLQQHVQSLQDLTKEAVKKYVGIIKSKLISILKQHQIFNKLNQIKKITQIAEFKELFTIFGGLDGEQQIIEQEQGAETNSDPRIFRIYFKTDQTADLFSNMKQRAKKINVKPQPKNQQINQRSYVRNLIGQIQRQPQKRLQNLQLLALKLTQFNFFQLAIQVYMDLGNPFILQNFLNQHYFSYVQKKHNNILYKFIQDQLIPYLQQKTTIFSNFDNANKFYQITQSCYDFIALNLAETPDQFADLIEIFNELEKPNQNQILELNQDINRRFSSFKAQIIQSINDRDLKNKKNGLVYTQVRKYVEAAQAVKTK